MRKLITARARKNKCTARMLANARKDHSIPLLCDIGGLWLSAQSYVVSYKLRTLLVLFGFSDLSANHCAGVASQARVA